VCHPLHATGAVSGRLPVERIGIGAEAEHVLVVVGVGVVWRRPSLGCAVARDPEIGGRHG
jgi:hypothetical protein